MRHLVVCSQRQTEEVISITKNELRLANGTVTFTGTPVEESVGKQLLFDCLYEILSTENNGNDRKETLYDNE